MDIKLNKNLAVFLSVFLVLLTASCKQEVFTESKVDEVEICSAYINSNPVGAQIYIDNKYTGYVTPNTIKWLSEENHKVTLRFNYIRDTSVVFKPNVSVISNIYVDYFATPRNFGNIICNSVPSGSAIYLNGEDKSKVTPNTISYVFPGNHMIKYKRVGYRDDSSSVIVYGGTSSYISLKLQDTTKWIDYRTINSNVPGDRVIAVKTDKLNVTWVGTLDNGIGKIVNGKFTNYNSSNSGLPYNFITCLEVDNANNLWVGSIYGLAKFDGTTWTIFKETVTSLPSNYITAIYADNENNVWVGTTKGLVRITNGIMTVYNTQNSGIENNSVACITKDNQGKVWIGVGGGISSFYNGVWTFYSRATDGLVGFDPVCFAVEPDGKVLAAFAESIEAGILGGIMRFDGSNWRVVSYEGIPNGRVQNIFIDKKGNKWFGTSLGFLVVKPDNSKTIYRSFDYAMNSYDVRGCSVDNNNVAWIALFGGGLLKWKQPN